MSEEDVARFAVRRFEFPGVDIKTRQTRWYPNNELAVHALGYVAAISESDLERIDRAAYAGTTLIGKLGVESAYEPQLHGTNGFREVLVNAQGRSVQKQGALTPDLQVQAPTAGQDLLLTHRHALAARRRRSARSTSAARWSPSTRPTATCIALVEPPRLRPEPVRPRPHARRVRGAQREHRPAAVQPRAARHVSVGLDHQAGDRARRPRHTTR